MKPTTQPVRWNRLAILCTGISSLCLVAMLCGCATSQRPASFDPDAAIGLWRTREIRSGSGMLESAGYYEWKVISKNNALEVEEDIKWVKTKTAPLGMPIFGLANLASLSATPSPPWKRVQTWDSAHRMLRLEETSPDGETYIYLIHFKTPRRAELTVGAQGEKFPRHPAKKIQ